MLTTIAISAREFLEVFFIIGVFLGLSLRLTLHREKEIIIAAIIGLVLSFIFPIVVFLLGKKAHVVVGGENMERLESLLAIFSGFFIIYVVLTLHKFFIAQRSHIINRAKDRLMEKGFDVSLFLTIVFLIAREGFEIGLFTSSTSLLLKFSQNLFSLIAGFIIASVFALIVSHIFLRIHLRKIFQLTEVIIFFLGVYYIGDGLIKLLRF